MNFETDSSTEEVAISLGAGKAKTFLTVTTPMMANGIISGAVLSWVAIVTELSNAIILYNNKTITLTMSTCAAISRGNDGMACAFAAILTILTAVSLILHLALTLSKNIKLYPSGENTLKHEILLRKEVTL